MLITADGGWSIAMVGARCLFAHSMIPFILGISSPPTQVGGSNDATIKSTEADGKSVTENFLQNYSVKPIQKSSYIFRC